MLWPSHKGVSSHWRPGTWLPQPLEVAWFPTETSREVLGKKHHSLGWAQVWDQAKKAEAHLKLDSHLGVKTQRFNSRARTKGDFVLLVSVVILFFD